ncbi:MAG: High-affinity nickel transporter [Verrucomicrobiales bacterium]|nr:High-affinity nickel transporter [Verrucomicrobiales bacterium]|tara:strand:+ start:4215 stop:4859 length:645 start_codon:yes stop_codon:yes gene_type:complete
MLGAWLGFLAGTIHVVSGPDHLAAVAPLSAREGEGARLGFRWGVGHSLGVAMVGLIALAFRDLIPIESFSGWSEVIVGVMLVAMGLWGLRIIQRGRVHHHEHEHGAVKHAHPHCHLQGGAHTHSHAAWLIGVLHGFAGSAHFCAVLPAIAMPTRLDSVLFLVAYGVGTIASMTLFAAGVGRMTRSRWIEPFGPNAVFGVCSLAALVCGTYWLVV